MDNQLVQYINTVAASYDISPLLLTEGQVDIDITIF